jgi:hypothetical protein
MIMVRTNHPFYMRGHHILKLISLDFQGRLDSMRMHILFLNIFFLNHVLRINAYTPFFY